MAHIQHIYIEPHGLDRFKTFLSEEMLREVTDHARLVSQNLGRRSVWNINSTASGGGVAEMLASLLAYPRAAGIDVRWCVIEGTPEFFILTRSMNDSM